MPCRSDHMKPTEAEEESMQVAHLIRYVHKCLDKRTPKWIHQAASRKLREISDDYSPDYVYFGYGNTRRLHEMTRLLCEEIKAMDSTQLDYIVYNGRDPTSRQLAAWWQRHEAADKLREEKEISEIRKNQLIEQAMKKLTTEEKKALGLAK